MLRKSVFFYISIIYISTSEVHHEKFQVICLTSFFKLISDVKPVYSHSTLTGVKKNTKKTCMTIRAWSDAVLLIIGQLGFHYCKAWSHDL